MESLKNEIRFVHYPEVREGPCVPYQNETQSIPVFRGAPLAIGAAMYVDRDPVQKLPPPSISPR